MWDTRKVLNRLQQWEAFYRGGDDNATIHIHFPTVSEPVRLLPNVLKSLSDVQLSEGASGTYSGISYRMWNINIHNIAVKHPDMLFQMPSGIQLCLKEITANISSSWHAEWQFLSDSGMVNVVMPDGFVCASIQVSTRNGLPQVKLAQVDADLDLESVSFSQSNFPWVMNWGAWLFQSKLEEVAANKIRDQVSTFINSDLARMLNDLDLKVLLPMPEVHDSLSINLALDYIGTKQDYLQVDIRGAISSVSHTDRVCPFPQEPFQSALPSTWSTRMASITASKRTVECGLLRTLCCFLLLPCLRPFYKHSLCQGFLWMLNSTGILSYTLLPSGVPDNALGLRDSHGGNKKHDMGTTHSKPWSLRNA